MALSDQNIFLMVLGSLCLRNLIISVFVGYLFSNIFLNFTCRNQDDENQLTLRKLNTGMKLLQQGPILRKSIKFSFSLSVFPAGFLSKK